jgi:hypothetical protein
MVRSRTFCRVIGFGIALLASSITWAAEGIISSVADGAGRYCYLRFPAIREETLYWNRPVLKDPASGDIISFNGPCDHDPLGKEEILGQREQYQRYRRRLPEGE